MQTCKHGSLVKLTPSMCMVRYNTDLAAFLLLLQFLIVFQKKNKKKKSKKKLKKKKVYSVYTVRLYIKFALWLEISTDVVKV